ncbi:MAG: hypothetical protein AVDCRST_MAG34-1915, partial [uncultured Nocardioidaceae bacterium]
VPRSCRSRRASRVTETASAPASPPSTRVRGAGVS